jgi:DNA-binding ferritin-like protein
MSEEIKKILENYKEETKRHFDVVAEKIEDKISTVGEQVVSNTEKVTALQEDMNEVKDTLEIIKLDIEFIKKELKQKVSWDEFTALEKRVSLLEAKTK